MIHTIRSVAVGDQESKIDSPIILYRGDREVEVEFTINGSKFTFTNGGNVIKSTNATHGQLVINTPTGENMFSEVTECHDGKVVFVITKEMIDELIEVGFYSFQIRLFDESQVSRVTIPPVLKGIDIRNPIAAEDETNVVDIALVDYSVIVKDEFEDLSTFLPDGNYNKTEWESKDVISGAKLNKIEDALYNINENMESSDLALLNRIENINKNINRGITEFMDTVEANIEELEEDINTTDSSLKALEEFTSTLDDTLKSIAFVMPEPINRSQNTSNLQNILDIAKNGNVNLTVLFEGGIYELDTCVIYDNTTIKMTNNTILSHKVATVHTDSSGGVHNMRVLFFNAKPFDSVDSEIIGYDGRSNITIEGGVIEAQCAMVLCHGKNITLRNILFKDSDSDHCLQIGACKNFKIQNCTFEGARSTGDNREYVEYVQLDWMTKKALPYWDETAVIFDGTINDGIEIDGCRFKPSESASYSFMATGFGSHSSDNGKVNKNITIKNCEFIDYSYAGISIHYMENVTIENNKFSTKKAGSNCLRSYYSSNITMNNNTIHKGPRAVYCMNSNNVRMINSTLKEINGETTMIFGESENIIVSNISIIDCILTSGNILVRNCSNFVGINNLDINTSSNGEFYRVYTKNDGSNNKITIYGTISDKKEINVVSANSIISAYREVLWSGILQNNTITLNDDITKFKNLKMIVNWYGTTSYDLVFVDNGYIFRAFNLPDDLSDGNLSIIFGEFKLTLSGNDITMSNSNQIYVENGAHRVATSNAYVSEISGERIRY